MVDLLGAYTQIFIMFAIVVVGYAATKLRYITPAGFSSINSLLIHIALPCMIVASVAALDPSTGAAQVPWFFGMAFAQFVLLVLVGMLLNALLRTPNWQQPLYLFGNVCTNTGFLCLPIIAAVYGDQTVLGSSIYVLVCNLFLGTVGIAILDRNTRLEIDQNIKVIPIEDADSPDLIAVYSVHNSNPHIRNMVRCLAEPLSAGKMNS